MEPLVEAKLEAHTISKLITNKNKNPISAEIQMQFDNPEIEMIDALNM